MDPGHAETLQNRLCIRGLIRLFKIQSINTNSSHSRTIYLKTKSLHYLF